MKKAGIVRRVIQMGLCIAAGVLLWILVLRNSTASSQNIVPDLFFTIGSVMFAAGLISLLNDMHTFTFASHSFRVFHQLFRGRQKTAKQDTEELLVKEKEKKKRDYPLFLGTGAFMIVLSVIFII